MSALHFPWLELAIMLPLLGAGIVNRTRNIERAQQLSVVLALLTWLSATGAWIDFGTLRTFEAHDRWDLVSGLLGDEFFVIDELSAPLIPLSALLFLMTAIATLRTKARRYSFAGALLSESLLLATLSCQKPWGIITFLILATLLPGWNLWTRRAPLRVYVLHMLLFAILLVAGQFLVDIGQSGSAILLIGTVLLLAAVWLRSGMFPLHLWVTDLFEHASFGTSLLYATPMIGAYAAVRLVLPIAPDWALRSIALASVFTAVYAAGMALIQSEARRFYCYLFLSHSSLVLAGVEIATPIGLTGALSVWLSVTLALTGLGLTLRSIEARFGRIALAHYRGLAEQTPLLAAFFLLTGLASAGFPGTFGFIGTELLIEGIIDTSPVIGFAVVLAAMLNGIAVLQVYFRIFTGASHRTSIDLTCRSPERLAVLTLTLLIFIGGIISQPGIASRYHAAVELISARKQKLSEQQSDDVVRASRRTFLAHEPDLNTTLSGVAVNERLRPVP